MEAKNKLKDAVDIVVEALKNDPAYYVSWKANIAMSFKDEFERHLKEQGKRTAVSKLNLNIHKVANTAADNFLNLLIN